MFAQNPLSDEHHQDDLLPDLRPYYLKPKFDPATNQGMWQVRDRVHSFTEPEVYALSCFVGKYTPSQVQTSCNKKFPSCPEDLVEKLVERLVTIGVLALDNISGEEQSPIISKSPLKPGLQWIEYRHWWLTEKIWILRNPSDRTFVFMNEPSTQAIELLETKSPQEIAQIFPDFSNLWQNLKAESMIVGTSPSKGKRRGKFNPMQLLFFEKPLGNPDRWLSRHVAKLGWLWSGTSGYGLLMLMMLTAVFTMHQSGDIVIYGQNIWKTQGSQLLIPFIIYSLAIVTLHELGHCFTLKHYARQVPQLDLQVPEVGVMFMCLMPTAYCQTTDGYFLPKVYQRALVVAAGVIVQLAIATGAFWIWQNSADWLKTTSYLVMTAAMLTVAWNLNPLAKFDGYHFLEAITGVLDLRGRSRDLYRDIITFHPSAEPRETRWILLAYAPFSLAYTFLVFGFLISKLLGWSMEHIPMLFLTLLIAWLIYFYFPEPKEKT